MRPSHTLVSWRRIALTGMMLGAAVLALAWRLDSRWFGDSPDGPAARAAHEVAEALGDRTRALRRAVDGLAGDPALGQALMAGEDGARSTFDRLALARLDEPAGQLAITVYSADGHVVAWHGRGSSLSAERLATRPTLFVLPQNSGLRLALVASVAADPAAPRGVGSIAGEILLGPARGVDPQGRVRHDIDTGLGPVRVLPATDPEAGAAGDAVVLRDLDGQPLVLARVDPATIAATRQYWWTLGLGAVGFVLATTLLLLGAALADWRDSGSRRRFQAGTLGLVGLLALARFVAWGTVPPAWHAPPPLTVAGAAGSWASALTRSPLDLLFHALLLLALVGLGASVIEYRRLTDRERRRSPEASLSQALQFLVSQVAAGALAALVFVAFALVLRFAVEHLRLDVLRLSLHPYHAGRLLSLAAIVLLHAAALWCAVLVLVRGIVGWRVSSVRPARTLGLVTLWTLPALLLAIVAVWRDWRLPVGPLLLCVAVAVTIALAWRKGSRAYRHGSQARRVVFAICALIVPSLLVYPLLVAEATAHTRRSIVSQYAVEALAHPRTLLTRLTEAQRLVDAIPDLADRVGAVPQAARLDTETAFALWRQTALATWHLTSAVEVYNRDGVLVSRFALNLPEYEPRSQRYQATSCAWEIFGEAAPFGADERRMLHAERGVCDEAGRVTGALVLHVMLDYATLSFISSQNPYFELSRGRASDVHDATPGQDVGLVIYGWGRTPIFTTTRRAWPLQDDLFQRLYQSNDGFWTELVLAGERSQVYFVNDRDGIYALTSPAFSRFDHGVHLAELATLGALTALSALLFASLFQRLAWRAPWTGRRLLREVRTSFSRKLFIAFVAATIAPVLILAFAIRAYVASRLRSDIEAEAARTAGVAQRVIEETLTAERRGEVVPAALDDDALVWISRVIDQDVNVYVGPQLVATSERDLFASGQLPTRLDHTVYRAIVLDRLPSHVGEDEIAGLRYLMAAAPVRPGGQPAVLTVPFTLRQREIEREIDELDRGVQLGAVLFILLGAGVGYWLAQRISDPVERLTRASQRIAAGNLDTRVFLRSADELKRLVDAFNRMAWELQRQRSQLERTNRLEAWADMARQVAHDIKNPLTPIQLSAEHLRRVHQDRGEPLSPVLENCVNTILAQVRLLRQIAAEFSSFATTPVPRPVDTHVPELLREIRDAYATGLEGRVDIVLEVAPDLPALLVDRALIGRALTNVVENALHAMPAGGTLTLRAERQAGTVALIVTDTGVGMDEESLSRLFEPYFSTKATGTGLGLTIARRNVELHGGSIDIASQRGRGTSVRIRLPVPPDPAAPV